MYYQKKIREAKAVSIRSGVSEVSRQGREGIFVEGNPWSPSGGIVTVFLNWGAVASVADTGGLGGGSKRTVSKVYKYMTILFKTSPTFFVEIGRKLCANFAWLPT